MERTKNKNNVDTTPVEGKLRFKKVGGGSLRLSNPSRIIKPGQIFEALPSEISQAFRDVVISVDGSVPWKKGKATIPVLTSPIVVTKSAYTIKPRGASKTWFDVVNQDEKVLNEKALQKEGAEKLKKILEEE